MKEAWLFEKLNTVGEDEHDIKRNKELEDNVKYVSEALEESLAAQSEAKNASGSGNHNGTN